MEIIYLGLFLLAFPAISFAIAALGLTVGVRIFFNLQDRGWPVVGFTIYVIVGFWTIGLAFAACVGYALAVDPHVPV